MLRFGLAAMLLAGGLGVAPRAQGESSAPGAVSRAEAAAMAEGWAALARGDLSGASAMATRVLRDYPRNPSSAAFAVEVGVAAQGWRGGLDAYDQWIAAWPVEHFYALRRVARAVLFDALGTLANIRLRIEVANALALDGDPDLAGWLQQMADTAATSQSVDSRTRAAAGDRAAVAALVAALPNDPRPVDTVAALGRSRNPDAIAPLVQMLASPRVEVRAAAASALGDLRAASAAPQLRRLLEDQQLLPRMAAVGSLLKLGDTSGMALAYEWFRSDIGDIKLKAAEVTSINPDAVWQAHVRQLLQDPDPMVRIGAARLLGRYDPGAAMSALQSLTNDQNLAIREEAQRVLPEAIGGDFTQLRRYLRAADADTRVRAALRIVELTR